MSKGGIRESSFDGSTDHLFRGKWNLGKTTTIRVPELLKTLLLRVAQAIDEQIEFLPDKTLVLEIVLGRKKLFHKLYDIKQQEEEKEAESKGVDWDIFWKEKLGIDDSYVNEYELLKDAYLEYLDSKEISLMMAKRARKGSVKRAYYDFFIWLENMQKAKALFVLRDEKKKLLNNNESSQEKK